MSPLTVSPELPLAQRVRSWRELILTRVLYGAVIFGGLQVLVEFILGLVRGTPNPLMLTLACATRGLGFLPINSI